ncbi:hypothetical protein ABPG72_019560 [Tetrahymena utriculariae]
MQNYADFENLPKQKEQVFDNKIDDTSKLDESNKFMNRQFSSYSINGQGADNRRGMFQNLQLEKFSKEQSDISANFDQDRFEDIYDDTNTFKNKKPSVFQRNLQNLEIKATSSKKCVDSQIFPASSQRASEEEISVKRNMHYPFKYASFDQKYGQSQDLYQSTVEKEGSQKYSPTNGLNNNQNNNNNNSSGSIYLDTPPMIKSSAKARRSTQIALKMKVFQGIFTKSNQFDQHDQSPQIQAQARKVNKAIQSSIIGNSPNFHNTNPFSYNQETIMQNCVKEKTFNQEDDSHLEQNKKQHLIILTYMKRFINQLLKRLSYNKIELISEQQFQMIGDQAFPPQCCQNIQNAFNEKNAFKMSLLSKRRFHFSQLNYEKKQGFKQFMVSFYLQRIGNSQIFSFLQKIPVTDPSSQYIIIWEALLLLTILFYLIFTPLNTSFQFQIDQQSYLSLFAYTSFHIFTGYIYGFSNRLL